jgi:hypothetical protein
MLILCFNVLVIFVKYNIYLVISMNQYRNIIVKQKNGYIKWVNQ